MGILFVPLLVYLLDSSPAKDRDMFFYGRLSVGIPAKKDREGGRKVAGC
jgi:hypothetical protein